MIMLQISYVSMRKILERAEISQKIEENALQRGQEEHVPQGNKQDQENQVQEVWFLWKQ